MTAGENPNTDPELDLEGVEPQIEEEIIESPKEEIPSKGDELEELRKQLQEANERAEKAQQAR